MAAKKRPVRGAGRKGPDSEEKKAKRAPTTTEKQPPPAAVAQRDEAERRGDEENRAPGYQRPEPAERAGTALTELTAVHMESLLS